MLVHSLSVSHPGFNFNPKDRALNARETSRIEMLGQLV
jgi:hypothetical protein